MFYLNHRAMQEVKDQDEYRAGPIDGIIVSTLQSIDK
jgi:hypothetical protein